MTPVMSYDELLARNVALIDRVCHKQAAEGSRFIDDLDLDSIDLVGLVAEMEAEFGVFDEPASLGGLDRKSTRLNSSH